MLYISDDWGLQILIISPKNNIHLLCLFFHICLLIFRILLYCITSLTSFSVSRILMHSWNFTLSMQEMTGLCSFMLDQSRKDSDYCMETAFTTYLVRYIYYNHMILHWLFGSANLPKLCYDILPPVFVAYDFYKMNFVILIGVIMVLRCMVTFVNFISLVWPHSKLMLMSAQEKFMFLYVKLCLAIVLMILFEENKDFYASILLVNSTCCLKCHLVEDQSGAMLSIFSSNLHILSFLCVIVFYDNHMPNATVLYLINMEN